MDKLDLQETETGWDYKLYSTHEKLLNSGHVNVSSLQSAIEKIDALIFGVNEIRQIIFLRQKG